MYVEEWLKFQKDKFNPVITPCASAMSGTLSAPALSYVIIILN